MATSKTTSPSPHGFLSCRYARGEVGAGDELCEILAINEVSVVDVTLVYIAKRFTKAGADLAERAIRVAALPESWKDYLRRKPAKS